MTTQQATSLNGFAAKASLGVFFMLVYSSLLAQTDNKRQEEYNLDDSHLAIDGYDPVSYFNGKALNGDNNIKTSYHGVVYNFANEKNKSRFIKNPDHFIPEYGGWCAYAIGKTNEKVKINPKTYKIVDGKLYLFYNFHHTNTLDDWNKDEQNLKIKADKNWSQLVN